VPTNWNLTVNESLYTHDGLNNVLPAIALSDGLALAPLLALRITPWLRSTDSIWFGDAASMSVVNSLSDGVALTDDVRALLDVLVAMGDQLRFEDAARVIYKLIVAEAVGIGSDLQAWRKLALEIADALSLAAGLRSTWNANVTVSAAVAFGDRLANLVPAALADAINLSSDQTAVLKATMQLLDSVRIADGLPAPSITMTALLADSFAIDASLSLQQVLAIALADGVDLLAQIAIDNGVYLAWVVNTETHAFTSYANYPFNSFATIGGKLYGAKTDGIYLLEGDDDAGVAIDAFARAGLDDFGSSKLKRMPSMYLGYTTSGRMLMKVTVMGDAGDREEHWYELEDRPANALREGRVKLGRGLKSTYWGFELANVDGADFSLDEISWYPIVLDRRL
jgi:hypothetical protein